MERINKVIAKSGICSRRKADELILEGKVKVNGEVVTNLGQQISSKDIVTVNNVEITKEEKKYYCLYKPSGIISSVKDEHNRKTVIDILPTELKKERLFPVGRLDYDTKYSFSIPLLGPTQAFIKSPSLVSKMTPLVS